MARCHVVSFAYICIKLIQLRRLLVATWHGACNISSMKRIFYLFVVPAVAVMAMAGCKVKPGPEPKTTAGKDHQVVVIADDDVWHGELAYAVCDVLEQDIPGLVRPEGYFDIVKQVSSKSATDIDKRYGLILTFNIQPTEVETTYKLSENVYARPQYLLTITAPNVEAAVSFVEQNGDMIRATFEECERNESLADDKRKPAKQLMADLKSHVGVDMLIPANFSKANPADEELLWYIRDYKNKAQYIFAFTVPCSADMSAKDKSVAVAEAINAKFNTITSKGASGSYMRITDYYPLERALVDVNGRKMIELRGRWDVANDFMGGSFVAYALEDGAADELDVIIFALYAPEDGHRNLMREMEYLVYTIK